MVKWLVVNVPSTYNAIIGRVTQTSIHMRTDVKYLRVIFETDDSDASILMDQKEARNVMSIAQRTMAPNTLKEQKENEIELEEI